MMHRWPSRMKIGLASRWLLITIRGRGPKSGFIYERRVIRYGQRIESRKRSYSLVAQLSVKQLRPCVWAHHQHIARGS